MLVDGSGTEPRRADVRIEGDRIAEISAANSTGERDANALPETVVEGRGLALSPGFIDMHAHSDLALVADKQHVAKISQGVTTEVVGQDGIGYAPITDEWLPTIRSQIAGWNGH
ncbi:MAG: amidohydrolase family protein, partial [Microbacteriaceae bacterium]|nr:amidohydrolase family protein [Microbacteriaceae bacterium]